jgi:hypothetical protein
VENAIDKFLKADGNDFALVRGAAKDFIIEHAAEIVEMKLLAGFMSRFCCGMSEQQEAQA